MISWVAEKKGVVGSGVWVGFGRMNIEQICGGAQSFSPKFWWHGRVNEKGRDNVVEGAK
jgi:hypothetical protein